MVISTHDSQRRLRLSCQNVVIFGRTSNGVDIMKKHYKAYVNGCPGAKELRMKLMEACKDLNVFDDQLYDLYIYTRPDSCLNDNLNLSEVLKELDKFDLLLPKNGHWRNGVNDQFAIGKSAAMKTYLDVYNNLKKYIDNDILFHPETLLKFHLKSNGIKIGYLELDNQLLRAENTLIFDTGKKIERISIQKLSYFIYKKALSAYKHIGKK